MYRLLTYCNTKTLKGEHLGYLTFVLHLAPNQLSGNNVCAASTPGCRASCLNTAGRGGWFKPGETLESNTNVVQQARKRKTRYFFENTSAFMQDLAEDIDCASKYATRRGFVPVFRLNGTSDIVWEKVKVLEGKTIFEIFPQWQFYDYTKILRTSCLTIPNYHLTFSRSETNQRQVDRAIELGLNVAVVFDQLPKWYLGRPVVDGDRSDLRFLDERNVVVGLKAKGRAKLDTSGFVVRLVAS